MIACCVVYAEALNVEALLLLLVCWHNCALYFSQSSTYSHCSGSIIIDLYQLITNLHFTHINCDQCYF